MTTAMASRVRRFVLWLLVAAVPWHAGAVAAMDHGSLAVPPAASVPCHDETMAAAGHEAPVAADAVAGTAKASEQPSSHCAACLACCAFAAPPAAVPVLGQAQPMGRLRPSAGTVPATFLTGGPLRPPRLLSV